MAEYIIRKAEEQDLLQIKRLQEENHFKALTEEEKEIWGFVSLETDIDALRDIYKDPGILVALKNSRIVGYEMPLTVQKIKKMPLFNQFIERVLNIRHKDKKLAEYRIIMEGQICIDKNHRGKGLAENMHNEFMNMIKGKYDLIFTDVSRQNPRSLHVHINKLGFKIADEYNEDGRDWCILIQDLSEH